MPGFQIKCSRLPQNRIFVITFRACSLLFAAWGIMAITGTFKNAFNPVALLAYTVQTNILAAIFFGILLTRTIFHTVGRGVGDVSSEKPYSFFPQLSAFVTLAIFVTMLVFWFILAPATVQGAGVGRLLTLDNLAVHLVTPLLMLADYVLLTERGKLKNYDPLLCAVIPYSYLLEAMILGLTRAVRYDSLGVHSYYLYIFLDVDRHGAWVILMVGAMTLFFLAIAFLWQRFDRKSGRA
ncbi:MAG: hypothetical protein LBF83_05535 [Spirochaetaceae bacterium]|jgi:hypothetical protein|nr:hypothetical protein [Spirochaetaceae bacterium]